MIKKVENYQIFFYQERPISYHHSFDMSKDVVIQKTALTKCSTKEQSFMIKGSKSFRFFIKKDLFHIITVLICLKTALNSSSFNSFWASSSSVAMLMGSILDLIPDFLTLERLASSGTGQREQGY